MLPGTSSSSGTCCKPRVGRFTGVLPGIFGSYSFGSITTSSIQGYIIYTAYYNMDSYVISIGFNHHPSSSTAFATPPTSSSSTGTTSRPSAQSRRCRTRCMNLPHCWTSLDISSRLKIAGPDPKGHGPNRSPGSVTKQTGSGTKNRRPRNENPRPRNENRTPRKENRRPPKENRRPRNLNQSPVSVYSYASHLDSSNPNRSPEPNTGD